MPLTMESAAALVPGAPMPTKTQRIVVVRPFMRGGAAVPVGDELTVSIFDAAELISAGKAVLPLPSSPPPEPPPAPATPPAARSAKATK